MEQIKQPQATMKVHPVSINDKTLKNVPASVPIILLSEDWAQHNQSQTLSRLNERGGLGVLEMLDNIHKRKVTMPHIETQLHVDELNKLIQEALFPRTPLKQGEVVYLKVSVKEGLPKEIGFYSANPSDFTSGYFDEYYFDGDKFFNEKITHWLKPIPLSTLIEEVMPTEEEVRTAVKALGKKSTAPDRDTPNWMERDIENGINWLKSRITNK